MRYVEPESLAPPNMVQPSKVRELAESMREDGWAGPPLLVDTAVDAPLDVEAARQFGRPPNAELLQAVSGSHRIMAAERAGLDTVPVADVDNVARKHGGRPAEMRANGRIDLMELRHVLDVERWGL